MDNASLRQSLILQAPPVPDFFVATGLPKAPEPPKPVAEWPNMALGDHGLINHWLSTYDTEACIYDELVFNTYPELHAAWLAYWAADRQHKLDCMARREAQWRAAYADRLIAELDAIKAVPASPSGGLHWFTYDEIETKVLNQVLNDDTRATRVSFTAKPAGAVTGRISVTRDGYTYWTTESTFHCEAPDGASLTEAAHKVFDLRAVSHYASAHLKLRYRGCTLTAIPDQSLTDFIQKWSALVEPPSRSDTKPTP